MTSAKRSASDMGQPPLGDAGSVNESVRLRPGLSSCSSGDNFPGQTQGEPNKIPRRPSSADVHSDKAQPEDEADDESDHGGEGAPDHAADHGADGEHEHENGSSAHRFIVRSDSSTGDEASLREACGSDEGLADMLTRLQDHHWQIQQAEVEICTKPDGSDWLLGGGSFGKVYKGILNASLSVAVKSINDRSNKAKVSFIEEIVCLMNLRHANVVQFFGAVIDEQHLLLITEFMPRGSLYDCIAHDRDGNLRWNKRGHVIALDIVRGLLFMHKRDCLHQDLKSMNVLMGRDWHAKICDVGMSSCPQIKAQPGNAPAALDWTAPEILRQGSGNYTEACDIFSLGVVLWEIASGKRPENRNFPIQASEECPEAVSDLIQRCLSDLPEDRPSTQEAFNALSQQLPPPTRTLDQGL